MKLLILAFTIFNGAFAIASETVLFQEPSLRSNYYETQESEQLIVSDEETDGFFRADLVTDNGEIQLAGYVKRDHKPVRGTKWCKAGYLGGWFKVPANQLCAYRPGFSFSGREL